VLSTALFFVEYWPAGQVWSMHAVFCPVPEYLPTPQLVQPSSADVAASLLDYCPAGQFWAVQEVLTPDESE